MSDDFRSKIVQLKQGNVRVRTSSDVTAVVWNDTRDVHVLTNIHNPPTEANFCQETGNALTPAVVEDYSRYIVGGGGGTSLRVTECLRATLLALSVVSGDPIHPSE
jgi:hypothetical protein